METINSVFTQLACTNRALLEEHLRSAREALESISSHSQLLDDASFERKQKSYTRNLIFSDDQISVWALIWAPDSSTPIHDHHCSCCFTVLRGSILETWYESIGNGKARQTGQTIRAPGYVASMMPSGPNIHQMQNLGTEEAISIHIYGYDHRLHLSSVLKQYERIDN